jgi:hypothetical protein
MLNIQKELRSGKTLAEICEPLGIKYKEQDGKVILSYDQIESSKFKNHPIVVECRGLILFTDNWDVACYPFSRFFNYNEPGADELPKDLGGCYVLTKLDGSLLSLWWDRVDNTYRVSTRKMMYAEGPVSDLVDKTFADLFREAAKNNTNLPFLIGSEMLSTKANYCYELCGPLNRIVTPYKETTITLLTVRDLTNLNELPRKNVEEVGVTQGVKVVDRVPLTDWETLLNMEKHESMFEGYVVVKENLAGSHSRVKVKNPAYLRISRLVSSHSMRAFVELVKKNEQDEFLSYYPEYLEQIMKIVDNLWKIWYSASEDYKRLCGIEDRKQFALEAQKCLFPSILFALRDNKTCLYNLGHYIADIRADSLISMFEKVENAKA